MVAVLITGFPAGMLACNCYVLAQRAGADAIVVDPGQRAMGQLRRILDENRLTPAAVLLTHGHIDHIWSAQRVADTYGCPAYIHPEDRFMLSDPIKGFGPRLGQIAFGALFREPKQVVELDRDGDKVDIGDTVVTIDHTPGHTRGSVVFRVAGDGSEIAFTGDTLFRQSVGRTDLPRGSGRDLIGSIMTKLMVLDDDTVVLPGHGEKSTIGFERRANPFLEGLTLGELPVPGPQGGARHLPPESAQFVAVRDGLLCGCTQRGVRRRRVADLRGHRAVRPRSRGVHGCGQQGDVHLRRPRRPLGDAAAGGHRGCDSRGDRTRS